MKSLTRTLLSVGAGLVLTGCDETPIMTRDINNDGKEDVLYGNPEKRTIEVLDVSQKDGGYLRFTQLSQPRTILSSRALPIFYNDNKGTYFFDGTNFIYNPNFEVIIGDKEESKK